VSPSGAEFIRQIKSEIAQVDPSDVHAALTGSGNGDGKLAVIDVRENEEVARGIIPGATHISRGFL
jgi:sulfur-carrier protein adenylyltransferase/sulfurtransferase